MIALMSVEGSAALAQISVAPTDFVGNIYDLALLLGGILAFGAIIYGAARYTMAAGNPSGQTEGKDAILQALLGVLLLFSAYMILHIVNPTLTDLYLPDLKELEVKEITTGTGSGERVCGQQGDPECKNSQAVLDVLDCVAKASTDTKPYNIVPVTTYDRTHKVNSCHFGGRLCKDGSHAIDWGINGAKAAKLTLGEIKAVAEACGAKSATTPTVCRYEDAKGNSVAASAANHIHCNVNVGACGCN